MIKIGIAEDDKKIASLLETALSESNYKVFVVANGLDALRYFTQQRFDVLIIDIMMPGINGVQLCNRLRKTGIKTPILMLTALGTVDDKVTGLEAGADDYLVKPFHLKELLARLSALLRRQQTSSELHQRVLSFDDVYMDMESKEVRRGEKLIELSAKEFVLLELFLRNPNRLLTRQYIAEQAWDINFERGTNVIDVYVNFLRKKIDRDFSRKLIHTKINMGYILK